MLFSSHAAFKSVPYAEFKSGSRGERHDTCCSNDYYQQICCSKKKFNRLYSTQKREKAHRLDIKANLGGGANNEQMGCES